MAIRSRNIYICESMTDIIEFPIQRQTWVFGDNEIKESVPNHWFVVTKEKLHVQL